MAFFTRCMQIALVRGAILASICGLTLWLGMAPQGRAATLPAYRPLDRVSGTIRVWGSRDDGALIEELEAGFRKYQPDLRFRETCTVRNRRSPRFTWTWRIWRSWRVRFGCRSRPWPSSGCTTIRRRSRDRECGTHGDPEAERPGVALAFVVNKVNPLSCMTLQQVDDVFAADHLRGGGNIRNGADCGLGAGGPVGRSTSMDPCSTMFPLSSCGARFSKAAASGLRITAVAGGWSELLETVARDPDGITFAPPLPGNQGVKALSLAAKSRGRAIRLLHKRRKNAPTR